MMRRLAFLARQNHRYFPIIKKSNRQQRRSNEWAAQSGHIVKNRSGASLCRGLCRRCASHHPWSSRKGIVTHRSCRDLFEN
jgi:hypothetical protein